MIRSVVFRQEPAKTYKAVMRCLDSTAIKNIRRLTAELGEEKEYPAKEFVDRGACIRYYGRDALPAQWRQRNRDAADSWRRMRILRRGVKPKEVLTGFLKDAKVDDVVKGAAVVRVGELLGREGGPLWGRAFSEVCRVWEQEATEYKCLYLRPGWQEEVVKDLGVEDWKEEWADERADEEQEWEDEEGGGGMVLWAEGGGEDEVQSLVEEEEDLFTSAMVQVCSKRPRDELVVAEVVTEVKKPKTVLGLEISEEKKRSVEWSERLRRMMEG